MLWVCKCVLFKVLYINLSGNFTPWFIIVNFVIAFDRWLNSFSSLNDLSKSLPLRPSFLISQKLYKMKHEFMHWGKFSDLISLSRLNEPTLDLGRPNPHSITILADDKRYPNFFFVLIFTPICKLFIQYGNSGTKNDLPKCIGTTGWPSKKTFLHCGIYPLRRLWFEVENILASWTYYLAIYLIHQ